jgi:hypothetical protein
MKTILFHENQLGFRGTTVSSYDYALYNETFLGNKSIICVPQHSNDLSALNKFRQKFSVFLYKNLEELFTIKHDIFYSIKYGHNDGIINPNVKSCVHVVFPCEDPHGNVYAYVSKWLSENMGNRHPYVPHMINLPDLNENFRDKLNINKEKFVFGWYGGNNFEIEFARKAVIDCATNRKDCVFLFMNQDPFCKLENVIFLQPTYDVATKVMFINTCDAMIHARERGETFGIAIGEFSSKNKPIITYSESPEKNHIKVLGQKGIYYKNYNELSKILKNIDKNQIKDNDWNCYKEFNPESVMNIFNNIFVN